MSMPPRSRTGSGPLIAGLIIAAVVVVSIVVLAASGATPRERLEQLLPDPRDRTAVTDRSTSVQNLYDFVFYIAVAIFLLVEGLIVWSVFRYRRKPTDTDLPPQTHGNNLVEVIWTVIPTAIVIVLFVDVLADAQHRRRQGAHRRHRPRRRGAVPVVVRLPGRHRRPRRKTLFTVALPVGDDGRHGPPGRRARARRAAVGRRHPRVLRPEVPVQAGRRAGRSQHVRLHGRGGGHLPRPVRRAVRRLPRRDAVRRPRRAPRRLRRLARGADREGQRDAAAARRRARPPGPALPSSTAAEHRLHDDRARGARRRAVHDPLQQRGRRASRTTSRSRTPTAASQFKGDIITGVAETQLRRCRRSPPARTPSSARSTRT